MTRLDGKVAIVTGAAQGIGKAIVSRLAAEGAKVALADVQLDSAEQSAAEIRSTGANAIAIRLDVTKLDDALAAADRVEQALVPLTEANGKGAGEKPESSRIAATVAAKSPDWN